MFSILMIYLKYIRNYTLSVRDVSRRSISTLIIRTDVIGQIRINQSFMEEHFIKNPKKVLLIQIYYFIL